MCGTPAVFTVRGNNFPGILYTIRARYDVTGYIRLSLKPCHMITVDQLESLGFRYNPRSRNYVASLCPYGITLHPDGSVLIDNTGDFGSPQVIFEGVLSFDQLREKVGIR